MWAFDFGFNDGFDTMVLLQMGYRVLAVEANPVLYHKGLAKFQNDSRLILKNIAIGQSAERKPFYTNLVNDEWSSFEQRVGCRTPGTFSTDTKSCTQRWVHSTSCAKIMKQYSPHIVKLDFEGGEEHCLQYIATMSAKPRYVVTELNTNTAKYLPYLLNLSEYTRYKVVRQYRVGNSASSGPLGEYGIDCRTNNWWEWRSASGRLDFTCPNATWMDVHVTMDPIAL